MSYDAYPVTLPTDMSDYSVRLYNIQMEQDIFICFPKNLVRKEDFGKCDTGNTFCDKSS